MALYPLERTSTGPLIPTKSHILVEVRDITNSKILQHICQIWLKLADLAKSAAKNAVSRGRKRLIESHQKQTNKQKFMFLS